ncbi:hypothetical protein AAEX28_11890 [Lentisphaerota bacterium WC36G]|nr:hypothetical protein LJT99_14725 [Lentisphaerae bacterium WC36]
MGYAVIRKNVFDMDKNYNKEINMRINLKHKQIQDLLSSIDYQLSKREMHKVRDNMELLAAEAILKQQLKTIQRLQHQQTKINTIFCSALILFLLLLIMSLLLF